MSWDTTRDAVLAELGSLRATIEGLGPDAWSAPTTCAGWTAGDCAAHVAQAIVNQQIAFQNMLAGDTDTPPWIEGVFKDPTDTVERMAAAHALAVDTMGRLRAEHADRPVPLPIGTFPTSVSLDIVLLEYGVHRWDIAHAVDAEASLSPAAAAAVLGLMPAFMAFFAAPPPATPIGYRLTSHTATIETSVQDGAWVQGPIPAGVATTTIAGDDAAIALFALGRITADDRRLQVDGADARSFKTSFPGP